MLSRVYTSRQCLKSVRCSRYFSSINQPLLDERDFFDIELKSRRPNKHSTKIPDQDLRDFNKLLDSLFEPPSASHSNAHKKKGSYEPFNQYKKTNKEILVNENIDNDDIESSIEHHILKLVMDSKPTYRSKAPLPQSFIATMFDETAEINTSDRPRKVNNIANDERIIEKEQENKVIENIASTKTGLDLLNILSTQIDNNSKTRYPRYYPKVLVKAMEHATFSFKDPYLAITIFERAKQKSLDSYIVGCTTEAYNATMRVRWNTWRDVYGVLKTLEEMTLNGITCNNESRSIVRSIASTVDEGGLFWNEDEQRAANVMKELVAKWQIKK